MLFFRQRLSWLLGCWLAFQLAGGILPLVGAAAAHGPSEELCTCPGGGHGAVCPMHHGERPARPADRDDDPRHCVIRGAAAAADLALLSLAVGVGPLPGVVTISSPAASGTSIALPTLVLFSRAPLPPAPPPRA